MFRPETEGGLGVSLQECVDTLLSPAAAYNKPQERPALQAAKNAMLERIKNFTGT
jgi:hypothetical protein